MAQHCKENIHLDWGWGRGKTGVIKILERPLLPNHLFIRKWEQSNDLFFLRGERGDLGGNYCILIEIDGIFKVAEDLDTGRSNLENAIIN